jgi:hypothetical protein
VTAPDLSTTEQQTVDRFGIFAEEELVEQAIVQALDSDDPNDWTPRALAAAAVAALRGPSPAEAGRCGHEAPRVVDGPPVHCALAAGHAGWHRGADGSEWSDRSPADKTTGAPVLLHPGEWRLSRADVVAASEKAEDSQ